MCTVNFGTSARPRVYGFSAAMPSLPGSDQSTPTGERPGQTTRGSCGLLFAVVQINREADWGMPEESLAIGRDSDRTALERMADPAEEAFLGSLHQHRRTADADQGLDRLSVFEFLAEPLTPLS